MGHTSGDSVLARVAHITKPKPNTNGPARPIDNLLYQLPVHIYIKYSARCQLARLLLFLFKNHFACLSTCFQGFEAMSGEVYSWYLKEKKKKQLFISPYAIAFTYCAIWLIRVTTTPTGLKILGGFLSLKSWGIAPGRENTKERRGGWAQEWKLRDLGKWLPQLQRIITAWNS